MPAVREDATKETDCSSGFKFFVFLINNFLVQEKKTQRELEELRSTFFIKELSQRDYLLYLPLCQSLS